MPTTTQSRIQMAWARVRLEGGRSASRIWEADQPAAPLRTQIGSSPECSWRIIAPGVEPQHAELYWSGQALWIADFHRAGKVFVDGEAISGWFELHDGSAVRIGTVALRVERGLGPSPAASDEDDARPTDLRFGTQEGPSDVVRAAEVLRNRTEILGEEDLDSVATSHIDLNSSPGLQVGPAILGGSAAQLPPYLAATLPAPDASATPPREPAVEPSSFLAKVVPFKRSPSLLGPLSSPSADRESPKIIQAPKVVKIAPSVPKAPKISPAVPKPEPQPPQQIVAPVLQPPAKPEAPAPDPHGSISRFVDPPPESRGERRRRKRRAKLKMRQRMRKLHGHSPLRTWLLGLVTVTTLIVVFVSNRDESSTPAAQTAPPPGPTAAPTPGPAGGTLTTTVPPNGAPSAILPQAVPGQPVPAPPPPATPQPPSNIPVDDPSADTQASTPAPAQADLADAIDDLAVVEGPKAGDLGGEGVVVADQAGGKTKARQAADALMGHREADALVRYQQLVLAHPDRTAYRGLVRILKRRLARRCQNGRLPNGEPCGSLE